ncbi:MAG: CRISPR-associated protein [Gimesia sp.]|uniref:CRISPR-associated helicase Cas3' n=1 Tax=Gimesia sp. TaxID=2024833 RepID=UPI000C569A1A|nr:CRISPR-associated helicase Cas3' [Gimesia sp.]MAX35171.1 CRISPR-associated protein [Gimesia sp.]
MTEYFGHSLKDRPVEEWEPLEAHLELVTEYALQFSKKLNATDWGALLGYWHDLGKYDSRFQTYLMQANGYLLHLEENSRVNHSSFGAQHALQRFPSPNEKPLAYLLAYCIMGHHAGLPDYADENAEPGRASSLSARLSDTSTLISLDQIPQQIHQMQPPARPQIRASNSDFPFQLAFWNRMLFSCLVDSDYLATEEFMSPDRTNYRPVLLDNEIWTAMEEALHQDLTSKSIQPRSKVSEIRQNILNSCLEKAKESPGFFSLTVPTGGGKTLSSLAFALKHRRCHHKERIIYAIPFTSIVEQTAGVFRNLFDTLDTDLVLEHHSNVDPDQEKYASRLATENWDAPLIVTTNVQLLESLFAAKPSRCRKLHRLINSVIILDEAQTLPVEFLKPCLKMLQELVTNYGCTIILCTATQPAITYRDQFDIGLKDVREIMPAPDGLSKQMKRVEVRSLGPVSQESLLDKLITHGSFLCIVNSKPDAARLFEKLKGMDTSEGLYHLSTNLCAVHRFQKLDEIRARLAQGKSCRVISTQLIEAGVDVDFPVVFRAIAGLDSIAQAAGRCNREGKLDSADVYVFESTGDGWTPLRGYLKRTAATTLAMIRDECSPLHTHGWLSLPAIEQYFRSNYWIHKNEWDDHEIMNQFYISATGTPEFYYREAAKRFRLIDDYQTSVFIPFDEKARQSLSQLRACLMSPDQTTATMQKRKLLRILQRYTVGLNQFTMHTMLGNDISELLDAQGQPTGYFELINLSCYDFKHLGFMPQQAGILDISQSVF